MDNYRDFSKIPDPFASEKESERVIPVSPEEPVDEVAIAGVLKAEQLPDVPTAEEYIAAEQAKKAREAQLAEQLTALEKTQQSNAKEEQIKPMNLNAIKENMAIFARTHEESGEPQAEPVVQTPKTVQVDSQPQAVQENPQTLKDIVSTQASEPLRQFVPNINKKEEIPSVPNAHKQTNPNVIIPNVESIWKGTKSNRVIFKPNDDLFNFNAMNRTLSFFLTNFFKRKNVSDRLKVSGLLIKNNKSEGVWEEGGATETNGKVLLATNPAGAKLEPVVVPARDENGCHALISVWKDCFLIMGGHLRGTSIIAVYHVDNTIHSGPESKYPRFDSSIVATLINGEWKMIQTQYQNIWNPDHPAIVAASKRIFDINAVDPVYITDYRQTRLDVEDFKDCLNDKDFSLRMRTFKSLSETYAYCDCLLGEKVLGTLSNENVVANILLTYYPEAKTVAMFILGGVYNLDTKSSRGGRCLYTRTLIHPGDSFYYLDQDESESISYDTLVKYLEKNRNHNSVLTVRRMTRYL
jgi:hypothetical protein